MLDSTRSSRSPRNFRSPRDLVPAANQYGSEKTAEEPKRNRELENRLLLVEKELPIYILNVVAKPGPVRRRRPACKVAPDSTKPRG